MKQIKIDKKNVFLQLFSGSLAAEKDPFYSVGNLHWVIKQRMKKK